MIETAHEKLQDRHGPPILGQSVIEQFIRKVARKRRIAPPAGIAKSPTLDASVNHGRWLVDCPTCASAMDVDPEFLYFFCLDCESVAYGRCWVPVKMPKNREAIEELLMVRAERRNQNWRPSETPADLKRENRAHGAGGSH